MQRQRQPGNQIASHHAHITHFYPDQLPGQSMKIGPRHSSLKSAHALRPQSYDRTGQNVSAARRRHTRVGERQDHHSTIRIGDHGKGTFEHNHRIPFGGHAPGHTLPVFLDILGRESFPHEACHLAWMRG